MKRIKIAIIAMAAVLIAALGIYFAATLYNNNKIRKAEEEAEKLVMFSFNADETDSLEINGEFGDYRIIYNNGWVLEDSDEFELNTSAVAAMIVTMSDLKAEKILESDEASEKFGFDDPIRITISSEGNEHTLLVGNNTATHEYIYMMKENDSNVYLVPRTTGMVFLMDKFSLMSTYIADFTSSEVNAFCLWSGDEKDENILFRMSAKDDGSWQMTAPYEDDSVYNTDIDTFINDVIRDQVSYFVDENLQESDYSKYGFDNPVNVFEISSANKHIKVVFGNDTENGSSMYVLLSDTGQVGVVEKENISLLRYSTFDMINPEIYSESISNVTSVEVTMPENKASLEIEASNKKYKCNNTEIDSTDEKAVSAFTDFYNSFNDAYLSSTEKNAEPDGKAVVTIEYTLINNIVSIIEYVPVSQNAEDGYYAIKNDKYTGYTVSKDVIENIISSYEKLEGYLK